MILFNSKILFMKHLLLFFLFSGSLDGFSQVSDSTQPLRQFDASKFGSPVMRTNEVKNIDRLVLGKLVRTDTMGIKPDTLRATLIVYYDRGPAILHTKPGFVVRALRTAIGSERYYNETFLDDKKKVIKAPWEVLTYKIKK